MEPRFLSSGKANPEKPPVENWEPVRPPRKLFGPVSLGSDSGRAHGSRRSRSCYLAHRPVALVVLGAVGILAAGLRLLSTIELEAVPVLDPF